MPGYDCGIIEVRWALYIVIIFKVAMGAFVLTVRNKLSFEGFLVS